MANATAITVRDLTANAVTTQPTADVLDTGTAAVTLAAAVGGIGNRVIFEVTNKAGTAVNLVVAVAAGDDPPAQNAGQGALTSANIAQNAVVYLGPFETGRFVKSSGSMSLTFTPASGTIGVEIRCLRLPKI
jgi:hypothetical protein